MRKTPPPLDTIVPLVQYQVIDEVAMKWRTVHTGPETPRSELAAYAAAGPGALLWVRETGLPRRPVVAVRS